MIESDYIPPRVPYASPLPSRIQPRLPGKPVQIMPPSPHRQGRRGYDSAWPNVSWQNMLAPVVVTGSCFFLLMFCVTVMTWGLGAFLAPVLAPFFAAWGVRWSATAGRVTTGQASRIALSMTTIAAAIPILLLASSRDYELRLAFGGLFTVTAAFAALGAVVASLGTGRPRNQPCVEL